MREDIHKLGRISGYVLLLLLLATLMASLFTGCRSGSSVDTPAVVSKALAPQPAPAYVAPETARLVTAVGHDGLYLKGSQTGHEIAATAYDLRDGVNPTTGKVLPARAGIIYDNTWYRDDYVHDVVVRVLPIPGTNSTYWGLRRYGLANARTERVLVMNVGREHGFYDEPWGDVTYVDCTAVDCGAQGLQLRLTNNRADAHWAIPKVVKVTRFTSLECGQKRGAGRAGYSISIKDLGPEATIILEDCYVRTVNQVAVAKRSDGRWADSFGALCVEYCKRLEVRRCYFGMKNPDRHAVQLFNYTDQAATRTGGDDILFEDNTLDFSNDLSVREGDGHVIVIRRNIGTGMIRVMRRGADGKWRLNRSIPLSQGAIL